MTNASEPTLFRLRVAYPKLGRLKYLGHLGLRRVPDPESRQRLGW